MFSHFAMLSFTSTGLADYVHGVRPDLKPGHCPVACQETCRKCYLWTCPRAYTVRRHAGETLFSNVPCDHLTNACLHDLMFKVLEYWLHRPCFVSTTLHALALALHITSCALFG